MTEPLRGAATAASPHSREETTQISEPNPLQRCKQAAQQANDTLRTFFLNPLMTKNWGQGRP